MLVLKIVLGNVILLLFSFLQSALKAHDRIGKVLLSEIRLLQSDDLVFLIPLNSFFKQALLGNPVLFQMLKFAFKIVDLIIRQNYSLDNSSGSLVRLNG